MKRYLMKYFYSTDKQSQLQQKPPILLSSLNVLGYCMFLNLKKKMLINVNNVIMYFPEKLLIIKNSAISS